MTFKEKIDKIKELRRWTLSKLAKESGLNSTLEKAYKDGKDGREMTDTSTLKFLQNSNINPEWWNTGQGEVFLPGGNKKNNTLRDVDIIEAENYIGMHRRVYDSLEKSLEMFQKLAVDAQRQASDLTQILAGRSGPGSGPLQGS
jgi:hypothetical protein